MDPAERMRLFLEELTPGRPIGFQGYYLAMAHPMGYGYTDFANESIRAMFDPEGGFVVELPWERGMSVCREEIGGYPCTNAWMNPASLREKYGDALPGGYLVCFDISSKQGPRVAWWVREGDYRFWLTEIANGGGVEPSIRVFGRKVAAILTAQRQVHAPGAV